MLLTVYVTLHWKQGRSPKTCWECPTTNRKICLPGTEHICCDRHEKAKVVTQNWIVLGIESQAKEFYAKGKLIF